MLILEQPGPILLTSVQKCSASVKTKMHCTDLWHIFVLFAFKTVLKMWHMICKLSVCCGQHGMHSSKICDLSKDEFVCVCQGT